MIDDRLHLQVHGLFRQARGCPRHQGVEAIEQLLDLGLVALHRGVDHLPLAAGGLVLDQPLVAVFDLDRFDS